MYAYLAKKTKSLSFFSIFNRRLLRACCLYIYMPRNGSQPPSLEGITPPQIGFSAAKKLQIPGDWLNLRQKFKPTRVLHCLHFLSLRSRLSRTASDPTRQIRPDARSVAIARTTARCRFPGVILFGKRKQNCFIGSAIWEPHVLQPHL